jgi:hypothetical protein
LSRRGFRQVGVTNNLNCFKSESSPGYFFLRLVMPKRFTATEIWDEDWFIELPLDYKIFWFYIKDKCDQAGFFRVNVLIFNATNHTNVDAEKSFELFNKGKKRLRKVNGSMWLLEDFFKFQYGQKFNPENKVHVGIERIYKGHGVSIGSLKGIERVSKVSKET